MLQGKSKVLGRKLVLMPLCSLRVPYGLAWIPGLSSGILVTNDMSHGMAQHNVAFFCYNIMDGTNGQFSKITHTHSLQVEQVGYGSWQGQVVVVVVVVVAVAAAIAAAAAAIVVAAVAPAAPAGFTHTHSIGGET